MTGPNDAANTQFAEFAEADNAAALERIYQLLNDHTGHDMRGYKTSTVLRRRRTMARAWRGCTAVAMPWRASSTRSSPPRRPPRPASPEATARSSTR